MDIIQHDYYPDYTQIIPRLYPDFPLDCYYHYYHYSSHYSSSSSQRAKRQDQLLPPHVGDPG